MSDHSYPWLKNYPEGVNWDMSIPRQAVYTMLDKTAQEHPDNIAFDFLDKEYSWSEIADLVNRFAKALQESGIEKGDRIGIFLPNCPFFLISYYAILKIGACVVNFNPLYAERELSMQIEDAEIDVMITANLSMLYSKMEHCLENTRLKKLILCKFTDALPWTKSILFQLFKRKDLSFPDDNKRISWFHDLIQNDGKFKACKINPEEDLAVLQYTGGTTGVPKGAMLTHYNVFANTAQSLSWFEDAKPGQETMLGVLPFFHVFAMTAVMNLSVMAGFKIIATPRFELKDALQIIHKKKPQYFPAVPAIYNAINHYPHLQKYNLSSLRYCISGGAPLPVEVKANFEKITSCVVVEGYGLSESSPVACINPIKGAENIAGSIGLPVPSTIIEIIDAEDKTSPMPIGERGELCIKGPQVMKGYWKHEEDTTSSLKNGRLHTGDIAIMDEQGYIYIVDRLKDMIITNGYNVYPRNVEEAIYMHPSVEECIVAGLPDKQRGEIVKAWIKLKDDRDLSVEDLKSFLKDKISAMEIPRQIEFRKEELPKTMIGKLSRKDIVEEELKG